METKTCSKCNKSKLLNEFNKDKRNKDGLNCWCRECMNEYKQQYREKVSCQEKVFCLSKICTKCGEEKSINYFSKDKKTKDGFAELCKSCKSLINLEWQRNNPEKHYKYSKKYQNKNKEKYRKYSKDYYNKNRNKCIESAKEWRMNNGEQIKNAKKTLYLKNHLRILLSGCVARAVSNGLNYDSVEELYRKLEPIYNIGLCECCGKGLAISQSKGFGQNSFSIDRIIPNNGYVVDNVAILCGECNRRKNNMTLADIKQMAAWMESKIS